MYNYLKWFFAYWKEAKSKYVIVIMLVVVMTCVKTVIPLFFKVIVDKFNTGYEIDTLYKLVFIYAIFVLSQEIGSMLLPILRSRINMFLGATIRDKYYSLYTSKSYKFFHKFSMGDLLTRLTDDIDGKKHSISWYSCTGFMVPLEAFLVLTFTLTAMFYYSVSLTIFSFFPIPLLAFNLVKAGTKMTHYTDKVQKSVSNCNDILDSCFSGIRIVKTTLCESNQLSKYKKAIKRRVENEKQLLKINQLIHLLSILSNHAGKITIIFLGSFYVLNGKITLGTFLLFTIYLEQLVQPVWALCYSYISLMQVSKYIDRLNETERYDAESNINNTKNRSTYEQPAVEDFNEKISSISLENISYRFSETQFVKTLSNISFTVKKGELLAIVGAIGSGKTTLLEILSGNYMPESGSILFNNKILTPGKKIAFRLKTGYVRQKSILFSGTIKENLILGDSFNDEDIIQALKHALVFDEVMHFPDQIDSVLGINGFLLSGGQKQRLSIARCLIRKPELILMDDITAAMDAKTEASFWSDFRLSHPEATNIIVTHRLTTAKQADKIIVLKDGEIVEHDTHENLFSNHSSVYNKIMNSKSA